MGMDVTLAWLGKGPASPSSSSSFPVMGLPLWLPKGPGGSSGYMGIGVTDAWS